MVIMLSSHRRTALVLLLGATITCAAALQAGGKPPATKIYPSAVITTYNQRVSDSPYNRPIKTGSLILPQVSMRMGPFQADGGRIRLPFGRSDLARIIWRVLPKSDKHDQYLQKRRELSGTGSDQRKLAQWCRQNGLALQAEYELRRQLFTMRDSRKPEYKSTLKQWLPYARKHQSDYTFALPVKGVWYVIIDRNKHHSAHAFTVFAKDLMIRKNGKHYRGDPKKNTSYYAWSQPIYAQADGVVEMMNNQFDDMPAGKYAAVNKANRIVIDYGAGILALYSHLQKGSVKVKAGDRVTCGQEIARVGNSGFSGHPHLHYALTDASYFSIKGRYRFQQRIGRGNWRQIDADALREGTDIRPAPPSAPKPKPATTRRKL